MTRGKIAGGVITIVLILLALAAALWNRGEDLNRTAELSPAIPPPAGLAASEVCQSFLYGRLTTDDGATYEGRLRWGGRRGGFLGRLLQRL